jgi:hypothetical protein
MTLHSLPSIAILAVCLLASEMQSVKNFARDGLAFNYPSGWTLQDSSSADKQEMTLARAGSDAQIRIFVYRGKIETDEQLAEARSKLIDPYIESNFKTFQQMGGHPERSPASSEIGGVKADGVRIRAVLDGDPGAAQTYWALLGQRLVVMTFFGPDKALKQMSSAWDTVRSSVQVEGSKPESKPSPTATPD